MSNSTSQTISQARKLKERQEIERLVMRESAMINEILGNRDVDAGTHPDGRWATVCGNSAIYYKFVLGKKETIKRVLARMPELSEAFYNQRGVEVRPTLLPIGIEVPHPIKRPLVLPSARIPDLPPHTMLMGRSYWHMQPPEEVTISLKQQPHTLVAGITGSGKSVELQNMITSLCWNTSPQDLEILVVDLKNEEGAALSRLPHVRDVAINIEQAKKMIMAVNEIKDARVAGGVWNGPALMLIIEEAAELFREWKGCEAPLGSIAGIGRSKGIYLVVTTQKPNRQSVGALLGANFTQRSVGVVNDSKESYYATGQGQLEAHLLPGPGAFLLVGVGSKPIRIQSYNMTDDDIARYAKQITAKWQAEAPAIVVSPPKGIGEGRQAAHQPTRLAPDDVLETLTTLQAINAQVAQEKDEQDEPEVEIVDTSSNTPSRAEQIAYIATAIEGYEAGQLTRMALHDIAKFIATNGDKLSNGKKGWSKAEMIRQAFIAQVITSPSSGGRNAEIFREGIQAYQQFATMGTAEAERA